MTLAYSESRTSAGPRTIATSLLLLSPQSSHFPDRPSRIWDGSGAPPELKVANAHSM
jgi:hypothetical protein